jgi:2'-5' RNA ligase
VTGSGPQQQLTRAFVGLDPPEDVATALAAWAREELAVREGVRALPAASLHITLAFLGNLDADSVAGARAVVESIDPRRIALRLEPGVVGVPRRRPRILALEEAGGEIGGLQEEVEGKLVAAGLLAPPERPFWPHLSVARVRRGALDGRHGRTVIAGLPPPPRSALAGFDAVRVALYRSELRSEGASYSSLADIYLPRSGD